MLSSIKTTLPSKYYRLLSIWVGLIAAPQDLPEYAQYIHQNIRAKDKGILSTYERLILDSLLKSADINLYNLYEYYLYFNEINFYDNFWIKLFNWLGWSNRDIDWDKINKPTPQIIEQDQEFSLNRERAYRFDILLEQYLTNFEFYEADKLYKENRGLIGLYEYEKYKSKHLLDYFKLNYLYNDKPLLLDAEQTEAVAALGYSILVKARAGSGKTQVITAKVMSLLENEGCNPGEILVLAFNRKVPEEIIKRLNENIKFLPDPLKYYGINVASTFHSLALKITKGGINILVEAKRNKFIKEIINDLRANDNKFKEFAFDFYREEAIEVDKQKFSDPQDYYDYLRNLRYRTLKGETVKSYSEKIIADFLFEHGIEYFYEYSFYPEKCQTTSSEINHKLKEKGSTKTTLPDFYLPEYNLVWENWALDEENKNSIAIEEFKLKFSITWQEYVQKMEWKRWFWGKWRIPLLTSTDANVQKIKSIQELLETKASDLLEGREYFELQISNLLIKHKVKLVKPDKEKLSEFLWNNTQDDLSKILIRFVDRYQQQDLQNKQAFYELMEKYAVSPRVHAFLQMGMKVLERYEEQLKELGNTLDFNQIVAMASKTISKGNADNYINKLKWILIDEFQDFSPLFYNLLQTIRQRNPEIKLFCVGDNWQAINGFAGADTKFFDNFSKYFPGSNQKTISTNYRSYPDIVNKSSKFMLNSGFTGKPAIPFSKEEGEQIIVGYIEDTFASTHKIGPMQYLDQEFKIQFPEFRSNKNLKPISIKYLKLMFQIVEQNVGKKIRFLHHNNKYLYGDQDSFKEKLINVLVAKQIYPNRDKAAEYIEFNTMHKSKGMEADVVVLLEVNEGVVPMYHPDNELFTIFGDTLDNITAEQKRLFYVAVTRGKQKTIIITSKKDKSSFIEKLIRK